MKVRFNAISEYIDELRKDQPPTKIIRLTRSYRHQNIQLPIQTLYLMSTYVNKHGEVVQLEMRMGDLWNSPDDKAVQEKAEAHLREIESEAEKFGIEVRPGVFDDGK